MKNIFLCLLFIFYFCEVYADNTDTPIDIRIGPSIQRGHGSDSTPKEDRGLEYKKYLSPSLKVSVKEGSGSGTIIYYDSSTNLAYVATCGHLWEPGTLLADQAQQKKIKCSVLTWYKNNEKLDKPASYKADLLFYSYTDGCDTALLQFTPDYVPEYFPIGPKNYIYPKGNFVHSMGCDGAKEVAHYEVQIVGIRGNDLVTTKNSPRPGRSGGGLVDENGIYIGTCWGTSIIDGSGDGFFTPLSVIHSFWKKNGYGFLLLNKDATKIKIYDRNFNKIIKDNLILLPNINF